MVQIMGMAGQQVPENTLLDTYDGRHWNYNGKPGIHRGLVRKGTHYYLVQRSDWKDGKSAAREMSKDSALDAILMADCLDVLPCFPELDQLLAKRLIASCAVMRQGAIS